LRLLQAVIYFIARNNDQSDASIMLTAKCRTLRNVGAIFLSNV